MSEEFLQYVWQHQLFDTKKLLTTENEKVEIISAGTLNTNAGPDFENARIRIDNTIWAGNIEIHTNSVNWKKHNHQNDQAYNNVILHVVSDYSAQAISADGRNIPTLIIEADKNLVSNYSELKSSTHKISCANSIELVDSFTWSNWLDRLATERLEEKTEDIKQVLSTTNNNWEESFYVLLAKSFGFKTNQLPFEMLARATPLKIVSKYHSSHMQLEALLFGQAGFLNETDGDEYYLNLRKEYHYLQKIHQLKPIETHLWKFMRLRPANFPTIRIAQFASRIHQSNRLFSKILEAEDIQTLKNLLSAGTSKYWETHYTFNKLSKASQKTLGKQSIYSLLINTIIPFIFIYGKERMQSQISTRAFKYLEELPGESNAIINTWNQLNIKSSCSLESQALIQLYNKYCNEKNCLYCHVGNVILTKQL